MTSHPPENAIFKSITVRCNVETAFHVWTEQIAKWWPEGHTLSGRSDSEVFFEGRILFVEDDDEVAADILAQLKETGYQVSHFKTAEDACAEYDAVTIYGSHTEAYDLAITELNLEGKVEGFAPDAPMRFALVSMQEIGSDASPQTTIAQGGTFSFTGDSAKPFIRHSACRQLISNRSWCERIVCLCTAAARDAMSRAATN